MTARRIVIALPHEVCARLLTPQARARLETCGDVVVCPAEGDLTDPRASAALAGADVLLSGWGTTTRGRPLLGLAPELGALIHSAGTVRPLVDESVFVRGVAISSQADNNARPVAEYTLAMILLAGKGVFESQRVYRDRRAAVDQHALLAYRGNHGLRVGVIGASRIGRRVLGLLAPFDVEPLLHDPYADEREAASLGARLVSLDELMASCAVVSLHAPLLAATRGMITARHLALLPDGATFINTARGALVDQDALVGELAAYRIDAVLDVTDPEVVDAASPLWQLPNVVLTPHVAGSAGNEISRLGEGAVAEVERFVNGRPLAHPVGRDQFDAMA